MRGCYGSFFKIFSRIRSRCHTPLLLLGLLASSCNGKIAVSGDGGGAGGTSHAGDGAAASAFHVRLSEIMYHPVVDDEPDSEYEFVEIYNTTDKAVKLDGWKIEGVIQFPFPAGATIDPQKYLVVAKNRQKVEKVYGLEAGKVVGEYLGELNNSGGRIVLYDAIGAEADSVKYDDGFPWPVAADALGASQRWFAASDVRADFTRHQHRGVSLERMSFDLPADEPATWAPSALDGATPGGPNSVGTTPKPVVIDRWAARKDGDVLIRASDEVRIHVQVSLPDQVVGLDVEYFVDDIERTGERTSTAPMEPVGASGPGVYEALMPAELHLDNRIIRYRIQARDRAGARTVVSPLPSDPNQWLAYFINPPKVVGDVAKGKVERVYQLFIKSSDWGDMWTNPGPKLYNGTYYTRITTGPTGQEDSGCTLREGFFADVPAVFIYKGIVHDVLVRYQGSQFNRLFGEQLESWSYPGPDKGPGSPASKEPPLLLAWHVSFPKFNAVDTKEFAGKRTSVDIKKLKFPSCQGFPNYVHNKVFETPGVGMTSARVRFVRFYVNGGYYGYMTDQGPADAGVAQRTEQQSGVLGDLFKANAFYFGPGRKTDGRMLETNPDCAGAPNSRPPCTAPNVPLNCSDPPVAPPVGWKNELWQIYKWNYTRETNGWKEAAIANNPMHPRDDVQVLIEGLDDARKKDCPDPLKLSCDNVTNRKPFMMANFDLERLRDYIAIRNFANPHDDLHHNYNLYKKADGKWLIIGWDFEGEYGDFTGQTGEVPHYDPKELSRSLYTGEWANPDNFPPDAGDPGKVTWNRFKDAYLKSFKTEYNARLRELVGAGRKCPPAPEKLQNGECLLKPQSQLTDPPNITNIIDGMIKEFDQADWDETRIKPLPANRSRTYQCDPQVIFDDNRGIKRWVRERAAYALTAIPP